MTSFLEKVRRKIWRLSEPSDSGDCDSNIKWNRHVWGSRLQWRRVHHYGYKWSDLKPQENYLAGEIAEKYLHPYLNGRRRLIILELAPGAGRFTTELIRLSKEIVLMDLNQACIDLCRERFKYYPNVQYIKNDGWTLEGVKNIEFDLIASYDAAVHMAPEVIENYVRQCVPILKPGGLIWLDHSGRGERAEGHRTAMTAERMAAFARELGLCVRDQPFRNDHDCISILEKPIVTIGEANNC